MIRGALQSGIFLRYDINKFDYRSTNIQKSLFDIIDNISRAQKIYDTMLKNNSLARLIEKSLQGIKNGIIADSGDTDIVFLIALFDSEYNIVQLSRYLMAVLKSNYDDKAYSVSNDMAYESGFITFVMKGPLKETDIVGYCDRYYQVSEAPTSIQAGGEISFTMKLVVENVKRWPYVGNPYIWCGHDRLTDSSGNSSLSGNSDGSGNYDSEGAYVNSALSHSMTVSGTIGVDICEPAFMSKQRSGLRMSALLSEANMIKHENICEL